MQQIGQHRYLNTLDRTAKVFKYTIQQRYYNTLDSKNLVVHQIEQQKHQNAKMLLSHSQTLISKICVNDFLVLQRGKGNDGRGWKRGRIRGRGYSTGSKRKGYCIKYKLEKLDEDNETLQYDYIQGENILSLLHNFKQTN